MAARLHGIAVLESARSAAGREKCVFIFILALVVSILPFTLAGRCSLMPRCLEAMALTPLLPS